MSILDFCEDYCRWLKARQQQLCLRTARRLSDRAGGRYSARTKSAVESVLREHYGRRTRKLIQQLREERARELLSISFQQTHHGQHGPAWRTLIELLSDQPFYLPRANPTRIIRGHNISRISELARHWVGLH